jgi:hypothetical protein
MTEVVTMLHMLLYWNPVFTESLFALPFPEEFMGLRFETAEQQNQEFLSHIAWRGRRFLLRDGNTTNENSAWRIVLIIQKTCIYGSPLIHILNIWLQKNVRNLNREEIIEMARKKINLFSRIYSRESKKVKLFLCLTNYALLHEGV